MTREEKMVGIDSDSVNRGSTPRPPANDFNRLPESSFKKPVFCYHFATISLQICTYHHQQNQTMKKDKGTRGETGGAGA